MYLKWQGVENYVQWAPVRQTVRRSVYSELELAWKRERDVRRNRKQRVWDLRIEKRVNSKLNTVPNKYRAEEEVDGWDGNAICSYSREIEKGCRDDRYGTRHVESAFDKKRGDGRTEHSNKQYD